MGTASEEIFDLFLALNSDFRLTNIFNSSGSSGLNLYLEPWLLFSIGDFENVCNQSLTYSTGIQAFTETLTQRNINMLAKIMKKYWLKKTVDDVKQINNFIRDRDFQMHSNAQNYKEKLNAYDKLSEEIDQLLIDYKLQDSAMWQSWQNQIFT